MQDVKLGGTLRQHPKDWDIKYDPVTDEFMRKVDGTFQLVLPKEVAQLVCYLYQEVQKSSIPMVEQIETLSGKVKDLIESVNTIQQNCDKYPAAIRAAAEHLDAATGGLPTDNLSTVQSVLN